MFTTYTGDYTTGATFTTTTTCHCYSQVNYSCTDTICHINLNTPFVQIVKTGFIKYMYLLYLETKNYRYMYI